jgi:hypothetical protein
VEWRERDFIYQVKPEAGRSVIRSFASVIEEQQIHLAKDNDGERTKLNLGVANEVMAGYYSVADCPAGFRLRSSRSLCPSLQGQSEMPPAGIEPAHAV